MRLFRDFRTANAAHRLAFKRPVFLHDLVLCHVHQFLPQNGIAVRAIRRFRQAVSRKGMLFSIQRVHVGHAEVFILRHRVGVRAGVGVCTDIADLALGRNEQVIFRQGFAAHVAHAELLVTILAAHFVHHNRVEHMLLVIGADDVQRLHDMRIRMGVRMLAGSLLRVLLIAAHVADTVAVKLMRFGHDFIAFDELALEHRAALNAAGFFHDFELDGVLILVDNRRVTHLLHDIRHGFFVFAQFFLGQDVTAQTANAAVRVDFMRLIRYGHLQRFAGADLRVAVRAMHIHAQRHRAGMRLAVGIRFQRTALRRHVLVIGIRMLARFAAVVTALAARLLGMLFRVAHDFVRRRFDNVTARLARGNLDDFFQPAVCAVAVVDRRLRIFVFDTFFDLAVLADRLTAADNTGFAAVILMFFGHRHVFFNHSHDIFAAVGTVADMGSFDRAGVRESVAVVLPVVAGQPLALVNQKRMRAARFGMTDVAHARLQPVDVMQLGMDFFALRFIIALTALRAAPALIQHIRAGMRAAVSVVCPVGQRLIIAERNCIRMLAVILMTADGADIILIILVPLLYLLGAERIPVARRMAGQARPIFVLIICIPMIQIIDGNKAVFVNFAADSRLLLGMRADIATERAHAVCIKAMRADSAASGAHAVRIGMFLILCLAVHIVFARDSAVRANPLLIHGYVAVVAVHPRRILPRFGLFDWVAVVLFIRMRAGIAANGTHAVGISMFSALLLAAHMVFARDSAIRANPLLIHIHIAAVVSKGRIIPCSGLFDWFADVLFIRMRTAKAASRADSVRIAVRFVYPFLAHIVFRDFLFAVRTNPSLIVLDLVLVMRIRANRTHVSPFLNLFAFCVWMLTFGIGRRRFLHNGIGQRRRRPAHVAQEQSRGQQIARRSFQFPAYHVFLSFRLLHIRKNA